MTGIRNPIDFACRSLFQRVGSWLRRQSSFMHGILPHVSATPATEEHDHEIITAHSPHSSTTLRPGVNNTTMSSRIEFKPDKWISFNNSNAVIDDLVDALTGAPLQRAPGLRQCQRCKAYYHSQSYEFILRENYGRCVGCLAANTLLAADCPTKNAPWPPLPAPVLVSPANYHAHSDRLVELEGDVVDVQQSRGGQQFALMFEQATWAKGIKLVIPSRLAYRLGGPGILFMLRAKTVRVRGLLKLHPLLGPQIMASGPEAIIWVR